MAVRCDSGWQSDKTLAECMRYMLDNEIATDVCFEVGPPDGTTVNLRAHKYMLISRSPVFEAMFSSGMTECRNGPEAKVRVEDIDADVFKELLTYIYCESVSLCPESAVSVMYAANKYMLPKLVGECGMYLLERLNVKNVINILEHALVFHDMELTNECLKLVSVNSLTVLNGDEILSASRQVMEAILGLDTIPLDELDIYECTREWAFCQIRGPEYPTGLHIREALGDLLYKIRFPTMPPHVFAEISAGQNVLNAEGKESIYYFLLTKKKRPELKFPTERRQGKEVWVDRTVSCIPGQWRPSLIADAINFRVNEDIVLTGIGLYTGYKRCGYDVDLEILNPTKSMFKKKITVPYTGSSDPFKVLLDEPIFVEAGVVYSVKALSHDIIGYYGDPCKAVCRKGKVTFTFSRNIKSYSMYETYGQIPRFYFCYL